MLQISMLVKELPPSLLQSGTEEEEEMMFFSLWREMGSDSTGLTSVDCSENRTVKPRSRSATIRSME